MALGNYIYVICEAKPGHQFVVPDHFECLLQTTNRVRCDGGQLAFVAGEYQ